MNINTLTHIVLSLMENSFQCEIANMRKSQSFSTTKETMDLEKSQLQEK